MSKRIAIDSLIHKTMENHRPLDSLRGIEKLPAFRKVVAEYLKHSPDEAQFMVENMILHYQMLHMRILMHRLGVAGVELDRKWPQIAEQWTAKRAQLVSLLREAADLFDSGQCDSAVYPSLKNYKENEIAEFRAVDEVLWCGSENLKRWAEIVATSPVEVVFPVAQPDSNLVPHESIKNRGGAANPDSAFRGMIVRETARYVPETMINKYAAISALATFMGQDGVDRIYVRGILLGGRT